MEHNLNLYGVALRYTLMLFFGMIGGLFNTMWFGMLFLVIAVYFFLLGILAYDPLLSLMGKNNAKTAVDDFQ